MKIEPIQIRCNDAEEWKVWIAGQRLTQDEMDLLAWRDGFRHPWDGDSREGLGSGGCFQLMAQFWTKAHGKKRHHYLPKEVDFRGVMIHWDYRQPISKRAAPKSASVQSPVSQQASKPGAQGGKEKSRD